MTKQSEDLHRGPTQPGAFMNEERILDELAALSPALKQQMVDFIHFLRERYAPASSAQRPDASPVRAEPFVGRWQDRQDMSDSTEWVRNLRTHEWGRQRG